MLRVDENDIPRVIQEYLWKNSHSANLPGVHFNLFNGAYFCITYTDITRILRIPLRTIEIAANNTKMQWEIINEPRLQEYILKNYFKKP